MIGTLMVDLVVGVARTRNATYLGKDRIRELGGSSGAARRNPRGG